MEKKKYDDSCPRRVTGLSPTWPKGEAARSLLLPSPIKVLCHCTGTLRTTVSNPRKQDPSCYVKSWKTWTSWAWAGPSEKFPPTSSWPALGTRTSSKNCPHYSPRLAVAPPNSCAWGAKDGTLNGDRPLAHPHCTPALTSLPRYGQHSPAHIQSLPLVQASRSWLCVVHSQE